MSPFIFEGKSTILFNIALLKYTKKNSMFQLFLSFAWQRPTLTGGNPQLPSALRSLTSVFGMGTGVTFSPSPPDYFIEMRIVPSKLDNVFQKVCNYEYRS